MLGAILGGVTGGIVAGVVALVLIAVAIVGVLSLLRDSPAQRAQKEVSSLFTGAGGKRTATVKACRQVGKRGTDRTFRCEIVAPECRRSFLFIEVAATFYTTTHVMQPADIADVALSDPCRVPSDPLSRSK